MELTSNLIYNVISKGIEFQSPAKSSSGRVIFPNVQSLIDIYLLWFIDTMFKLTITFDQSTTIFLEKKLLINELT